MHRALRILYYMKPGTKIQDETSSLLKTKSNHILYVRYKHETALGYADSSETCPYWIFGHLEH